MIQRNRQHRVFALAVGLCLLGSAFVTADAAKKYYPPGFTPPTETTAPATEPAPTVIIQPVPGAKQVIIKTVPVKVSTSKDPLMVLMDEHRYFDALRLVDTRLKKNPKSITLQVIRGSILREQGSYTPSVKYFQAMLQEKNLPKTSRAALLNGLGWTYVQRARHERQLGDTEAMNHSLQSAVTTFGQATQLSPNMAFAWAGLGQASLLSGNLSEADKAIKKATALSPNDINVELAHATLLLAKDKPDDALQVLYGLKKTTTHEPDVFLLLAQASLKTGKVDDAIINLKQLLELDPEHPEALKLLSHSYELKMMPDDAEEVLEKAIALNPADQKSVLALLTIYDQNSESERAIAVLQNLLREHPEQVVYGEALLERLGRRGDWDGAYAQGLSLMGPSLASGADKAESQDVLRQMVALFSRAVYLHGRGLLDRDAILTQTAVQQTRRYALKSYQQSMGDPASPAAMTDRLSVLLLDPLSILPALPSNFQPAVAALQNAIEMAFLQGDWPLHEQLLTSGDQLPHRLQTAHSLYELGDYRGAAVLTSQELAKNPDSSEALALQAQLVAMDKTVREQLQSLSMLPRKISESYWQKAASDVLKVSSGDWKTHAAVADALEKRHQPSLALLHEKLAAQYAPNAKEKQYWLRRAARINRQLERSASSATAKGS